MGVYHSFEKMKPQLCFFLKTLSSYNIAHPKSKSSALLIPCGSGYYTVHIIPANSLILNESKIW